MKLAEIRNQIESADYAELAKKMYEIGCQLRCNIGWQDGEQRILSYSAMRNGKEIAKAENKSALLKVLQTK